MNSWIRDKMGAATAANAATYSRPRYASAGPRRKPSVSLGFLPLRQHTVDPAFCAGLCAVVRLPAARARAHRHPDAARRHLEPFPHRGPARDPRLGSVQRHRRRRPRHSPGAPRLARAHAGFHHFRGSHHRLRQLAAPALPLAEGLHPDLAGAHAQPRAALSQCRFLGFRRLPAVHRRHLRFGAAQSDPVEHHARCGAVRFAGVRRGACLYRLSRHRQELLRRPDDVRAVPARLVRIDAVRIAGAVLLDADFARRLSRALAADRPALALGEDAPRSQPVLGERAMMRRLLIAIVVAGLSHPALAGAWTQNEGTTQIILGSTYSVADESFSASGLKPVSFAKLWNSIWAEYGWSDDLTLIASPEYAWARTQSPTQPRMQASDFAFGGGLRYLLTDSFGELSVQATVKSAGAFDMSVAVDHQAGEEAELRL